MELKQGDVFSFTNIGFLGNRLSESELGIIVNDGPSWRASPRGCYIFLRKQEDGNHIVSSIIKEQGPAIGMAALNKDILDGVVREVYKRAITTTVPRS